MNKTITNIPHWNHQRHYEKYDINLQISQLLIDVEDNDQLYLHGRITYSFHEYNRNEYIL